MFESGTNAKCRNVRYISAIERKAEVKPAVRWVANATQERLWTPEEGERLRAMVANGDSPARASAALKRNLTSVRRQAQIGIATDIRTIWRYYTRIAIFEPSVSH
jgi:hypothetical protein